MKRFLLTFSLAVIYSCFLSLNAQQYVPVLQETFSKCSSTTIQGGYFSESTYFEPNEHGDNEGWYSQNTYPSEKAVKLGTKVKTGYITSPQLKFSQETASEIRVQFRAQLWFTGTTKDTTNIVVSVDGMEGSAQKMDILESNNVVDRNLAPYQLTFKNVPSGAKLRFTAEKPNGISRFFLTEVIVSEKREGNTEKILSTSAYYHHFENLMAGDQSEENTISISGENLSEDITIEAESDRPSFTITKAATWNARNGGDLSIHFVPVNAGDKEEVFNIKSGDLTQRIILTGKAKVFAPVAIQPTAVSDNSITCAWNPVAGIDKFVATIYTKSEKPLQATDLFISKYIEGKSNNRALEIFNGTGKTVDLNGYALRMETNGAGGLTSSEFKFPDVKLENGKTYTIANAQYTAVREVADSLIGFQSGGYSNIVTFTGDDAIGLFNPEDKLIDIIGYENPDINSTVDANWGQDKSYYRKSNVYAPSDKFYLEEWDIHEMDYAESYGTHTMDATGLVRNIIAKKEADGTATSVVADGLNSGTTYFYAIQGFSNNLKTHYSSEIEAKTTGESGIEEMEADAPSYRLEGNRLQVDADNVSVYDATGLQLKASQGSYTLPKHGIYLIRGEKQTVKIVY